MSIPNENDSKQSITTSDVDHKNDSASLTAPVSSVDASISSDDNNFMLSSLADFQKVVHLYPSYDLISPSAYSSCVCVSSLIAGPANWHINSLPRVVGEIRGRYNGSLL
jgi:hypothetical protein